jgi:glycerophosphoryl diester phosphodiesterase
VKPEPIGHRGAAAVAPENTIASMRAALDAGVAAIEFDVRLTADGVPVVIHDATLDRTTDATGPIASHTLADLNGVDAGSWFDPKYSTERIPSLDDVLDLLEGRARAIVELKTEHRGDFVLRDAVLTTLAARRDRSAFVFTSMDWTLLEGTHDRVRDLEVALTVAFREHRDPIAAAPTYGATAVHPHRARSGTRFTARAHAAGLAVRPYTVNRAAHLAPLVRAGVDAAFTDDPARWNELLAEVANRT